MNKRMIKKTKKKILFIHPYFGNGGAEKGISILARSLKDKGYSIDLICIDIFAENLIKKYRYINFIEISSKRIIATLVPFVKIILKNNYDIVIPTQSPSISFFTPVIYFFNLTRKRQIKIICFERLSPEFYFNKGKFKILKKILYYLSLQLSDCLLTNSLEQLINYKFKLPNKRSFYIPNSSSCTHLINNNKDNYVERNNRINNIDILWIGRLEEIKDPLLAIDILKTLGEKYRLSIYGDGTLKNKIINKVRNLNLEKNIRFLHNKNKINFTDYDVFLHTSYFEGLPNTFLEVLYNNIPIVSTCFTTGLSELFIPFWVYPSSRDKYEIKKMIIKSLSSKDKKIRKTVPIKLLIKEHYNDSNMNENFLNVINKVYKGQI